MSDYIRTMTKDYNINLRYKLVPSEKVLDQLALELNKVTKQYNNHLIDYETFDNLKNLIVAKQDKAILKWQSETGVCFYTGQCLEQIKQDKKDIIVSERQLLQYNRQLAKLQKNKPALKQANKVLGLSVLEWAGAWCIVLLVLGA